MPPVPEDAYQKDLEVSGLDRAWRDAVLDGGHYLQRLWQKVGLESARLDPTCDGYIYWTIADVNYFGDQGLLDQFWDQKKTTPRYFRQFNSPTAVLAAHDQAPISAEQRILAEGDDLTVDWWISHFGEEPLQQAVLEWRVETDDRVLGEGRIEGIDAKVGDVKQVGTLQFTIEDVDKPVKARLTAQIVGTSAKNSWDLWLFPRLRPQEGAGKGLVASESVYRVLESRYPGLTLVGDSNASDADVLITDHMDGTFLEALSNGKSVLLLHLIGPRPDVRPGWWATSNQAGTAVAEHPAFGDFPHDGYLSQLFFRLLKDTSTCREEEYRDVEKLMVTHGTQGYLTHVFQAKVGQGRLLACGLDVLSNNTEAEYLLDQFIKYVQSSQFDPQGEFDAREARKRVEAMANINGWSDTVVQHQQLSYESFLGDLTMDLARCAEGQVEVAWLTQPVPEDLKSSDVYTFRWLTALGYKSEPAAEFQLMLDDEMLLSFGVTEEKTTWSSVDGEVTLKYMPKTIMTRGEDSSGIMELTLPASMLEGGKKALLRVVAPQTGSRRWFGLYHYP